MEDAAVITGLLAKRAQIAKRIVDLRKQITKKAEIGQIDTAIGLFATDLTAAKRKASRFAVVGQFECRLSTLSWTFAAGGSRSDFGRLQTGSFQAQSAKTGHPYRTSGPTTRPWRSPSTAKLSSQVIPTGPSTCGTTPAPAEMRPD